MFNPTFGYHHQGRVVQSVIDVVWRIMIILVSSLAPTYSYAEEERKLLLLYSYHPSFMTSPKVYEGLTAGLAHLDIGIDLEFMDSKRLYDDKSLSNYYQSLAYKLSHRAKYDYVVTSDDNALRFVLEHQSTLFPSTPIVFLGVNDTVLAKQQANNPLVTGTVEAASFRDNIELIVDIFPNNNKVHVIYDGTTSGQADFQSIQLITQLQPTINWSFIDLSQQTWTSFQSNLQGLTEGAILLLSAYKDADNTSKSFEDSLALIVENSSLPIFHPYEHGLGDGITGGVMVSHTQQAKVAASIITQLESGTPISTIPIVEKSPNLTLFDARKVQHYHIRRDLIPESAELRFQEPSPIEVYEKEIISTLSFALLVAILVQGNRYLRERQIKKSEKELRLILDSIESCIYLKDLDGKYLFANRALLEQLDISQEHIIGKTVFNIYPYATARAISRIDNAVISNIETYTKDESHCHEAESPQIFHTKKIPLVDESNSVYALCGVSTDVTVQRTQHKVLEQAAYYDPLTGLPNRVSFINKLTEKMATYQEGQKQLSLAFFDLDNFTRVNSQYGHNMGDEILKKLFHLLQEHFSQVDVEIARIGGDEFYLLFDSDKLGVYPIESVLTLIQTPLHYQGHDIYLSASCGVTYFPQDSDVEPEQLFRQSEHALFVAKKRGYGQVEVYKSEHESSVSVARQEELSQAFDQNQFVLVYQPKINLSDSSVIGVEALIRWHHPLQGLLPPALFLPDVEDLGLMKRLDNWVLDTALSQLNRWYSEGLVLPISINLSNEYFNQPNVNQFVEQKMLQYPNLPAQLFEIEIVETREIESLSAVASVIQSFNSLGVKFALDDFGTGYSSLAYLQQLPVQILKVDRSFVINMLDDPKDRHILHGILGFCKAFGLQSVAEGVESQEHIELLKDMGFDIAQGYQISKPLVHDDLIAWLQGQILSAKI